MGVGIGINTSLIPLCLIFRRAVLNAKKFSLRSNETCHRRNPVYTLVSRKVLLVGSVGNERAFVLSKAPKNGLILGS